MGDRSTAERQREERSPEGSIRQGMLKVDRGHADEADRREGSMAIMRPPLEECDRLITPLNEGEPRVAEKLSELDDEWTV